MSDMSLEATLATWELPKKQVSSHEKYLLLSLARRAGEDHTCWPSIRRMCEDTGLDRKTVISIRQSLEHKGLIKYTGEMKGRSGQVPVMQLPYVYDWEKKRNSPRLHDQEDLHALTSPKSGTGKTSTSPKTGTGTSTENGTGTSPKNGTLNIKGEYKRGNKSSYASRPKSQDQQPPNDEPLPDDHFLKPVFRKQSNERKHEFAENMNRQANVHSTVQFFGPGHPTWEAQQEWKRQLEAEKKSVS
jgi:DNA-binding transcriptional MocR family regulator